MKYFAIKILKTSCKGIVFIFFKLFDCWTLNLMMENKFIKRKKFKYY
jgi:hypothetical protein